MVKVRAVSGAGRWGNGAGLCHQRCRSVRSMAQVSAVSGACPYRPLVANSLLLSHFLKILVPFCAEDYQHLADYQPFSCHQNRVVEGPGGGPSRARRTATGAKTGETVAMADLSARQRHDMGPNRAASGPLMQVWPHSSRPPAPCGAQRRRTQPSAAASKTRNHRLAIRGSAVSGEPSRAP